MKKITLLLFLISNIIYSQVLNQPANWPNENWTTSGEYTPVGLIAEPSTSDSFTFDDDAAGNTSLADIIMSESPVIDLTAAFNAGEVFISISGEYSHYDIGGYLGVEYYSADSNNWDYGVLDLQNTTNTVADYQNCENQVDFETVIDISGFTANELANFKYRFYYMDGNGWQWGWCIKSPSIISSSSVDCPNPEFYYWSMGTTMVGFSGSNNATVTYYEIEYNLGETFTPGDGTAESFTFTEFPNTITGLEPDSVYYFTSRSVCSDGSTSEWNDNSFNGDGPDPWSTFAASEDCTDEYDLPIIWSDNFECHESFAIDNIEGWTSIDLEGGQTFWPNDGIYPNAGYVGAGIIWNNAQANFLPAWNPIEGDQGLYFFASNKEREIINKRKDREREADEWGGFFAQVAGYNSLDHGAEALKSIYKAYELKDDIKGYPSLQNRIGIINSNIDKVNDLVKYFEIANLSLIFNKTDLANSFYDELFKNSINSSEIYNNFGVSLLLKVINSSEDFSKYNYPLFIDNKTIVKVKTRSISKNADIELINEAIEYPKLYKMVHAPSEFIFRWRNN